MKRIFVGAGLVLFLSIFFSGRAQEVTTAEKFRQDHGGLVLLKNHGGILPLVNDTIKTIALIGPSVFDPGTGWGSGSGVYLESYISPYEAFTNMAGDTINILTSVGVNAKNDITPIDSQFVYIGQGVRGFSAKYYNNQKAGGSPVKFTTDKQLNFNWGTEPPYAELKDTFSVSWDATLIPGHGSAKVKLIHNDGCRLYLDGKLLIDAWKPGPLRVDSAWLNIEKGKSYNLQIDYFTLGGPSMIKFGFDYLESFTLYDAVEKARRADVAIVFTAKPFLQRESDEPGKLVNQSRLIRNVYEANPNTIVVLQTDEIPDIENWVFDIPVVMQAWAPHRESGLDIATVVMGKTSPQGKLPVRWTMNERQNYDTRFPYGFGLTYTTFGIGKLMMYRERNGSGWYATVEIRNLGNRAGTETLQLYIQKVNGENDPKAREIKAYKKVTLWPLQKKTVSIPLPYAAFEYDKGQSGKLTIDPGKYKIMAGTSAEDIKLVKIIELKQEHINQYYGYE